MNSASGAADFLPLTIEDTHDNCSNEYWTIRSRHRSLEPTEGLSVQMSDPVRDLEYARNAVTLTFDLSGFEHVRLSFAALEYGDEPHAPKSEEGIEKGENDGVFGPVADFDLDGVAVSADGVHSEIPGQTRMALRLSSGVRENSMGTRPSRSRVEALSAWL